MSKRWYVVHAYSGMEKSVGRAIQERIDRSGMQDCFGRILVPTEEVVEMKNGQRTISERRFFPGYVFVEMELTDESWHLVKNTNKVTGFVGVVAGIDPPRFLKRMWKKSWPRFKRALKNPVRRFCLKSAKWCVSKMGRLPISTAVLKR